MVVGGGAFGCGQCLPCRVHRRRVWQHRILLEAAQHEFNCFATLTYSDDNLPGDNSVSPRELTLFFKRLRKVVAGPIRYFACGEYGDRTGRPHYHAAIFGLAGCQFGVTTSTSKYCCEACDVVYRAWGKGSILLGGLEPKSASYIAGYVSKKWTKHNDPSGRHPSFARMSLRPGIGLGMMHELASVLLQHKLDERMIDVPLTLQHGTKQLPLGRYLRRKLRTFIGRDANTPKEVLEQQKQELQTVREDAWANKKSVKATLLEKSLGKRIQIEARHRRHKRETV